MIKINDLIDFIPLFMINYLNKY
ncbi:hypothetical protein FPC831_280016 [Flavobacterium psychrophilum]|nr:hypothetical protein FPC831_280016 [Flavobacterium psychrophilum]SNB06774.1 hypothetical protein KU06112801_1540002 [Flavobacterium psychrophilum]SNB13679.1 hypothetical protein JIP1600_2280002 [Flavobacterium psychrophilum]SNB96606.1 hypothetical protein FPC840_2410002 [Flavobacterium psychrophilum]